MIRQPALALTVTVSALPAQDGAPAAIGLVFAARDGRVLRRVGRTVGPLSREAAGFRGLLHALWLARRFGARSVTIGCDVPEVVAMAQSRSDDRARLPAAAGLRIIGDASAPEAIPDDLVGPFLQVRALVHTYKAVNLVAVVDEAAEAAAAARDAQRGGADQDVTVDDLPLWSDQEPAPA